MSTTTMTSPSLTAGREDDTAAGSDLAAAPGLDAGDRQILVRVDRGGILIGEGELRYQLERKDAHPLAQEDELMDVLDELEARGLVKAELCFRLTATGRALLGGGGGVIAVGCERWCGDLPGVVGGGVRERARVLAQLFTDDQRLARELNAAQARLRGACEQLRALGVAGLDEVAVAPPALEVLADSIRWAFADHQRTGEDRRRLAADVGEATIRLVDAMRDAGFSEAQARNADVWALRDGVYRPHESEG